MDTLTSKTAADTGMAEGGKKSNPAIGLEETRLKDITGMDDFNMFHERHRIFPALFEDRNHNRIIDLSAGIGAAASRVDKDYNAELVCNELAPKCISILEQQGLKTLSFDLDDPSKPFPIGDGEFDAVISLATIEHLYNTDHFLQEIRRILTDEGCLYISAPNYNGVNYLIPLLLKGKTFHDPLNPMEKYEFFGHLRYFTLRTMIEYLTTHGFAAEAVYLGKPEMGTRYLRFKSRHKIGGVLYRMLTVTMFYLCPARWASEPVVCFRKRQDPELVLKPRKKVL